MKVQRSAAASAVALAMLAVPAQGQAAGLIPNKACYGGNDTVVLTGSAYTPNAGVALGVSALGRNRALADQRADAAGLFSYRATTPYQLGTGVRTRTDTYTAVDRARPANRASARVRLRRLRVRIASPRGTTLERQRIRATGFTAGRTLYAHVRRLGGGVRTFRLGRLRGACRSIRVRRRLFPGRARTANRRSATYPGRYRIQFDTARTYSRARPQQFAYPVTIRRVTRRVRGEAPILELGPS